MQRAAPTELVVVSQPKAFSADELTDYFFDESSGEDVTIYILDSGLNTDHPVRTPPSDFLPLFNPGADGLVGIYQLS
jgi:hypothetical protein